MANELGAQYIRAMPDEAPKQRKSGNGRGYRLELTDLQRKAARRLFGMGANYRQVAENLGISKTAAQAHLREEHDMGREDANLQIQGKIFQLAMGSAGKPQSGNPTMLIWWSKNNMGWADRQEVNNLNPPTIQHELSLRVEYVQSADPRALAPPPPGTPMIEGRVIKET